MASESTYTPILFKAERPLASVAVSAKSFSTPLSFAEITVELAEELEVMRPFGKENPQALFATKNVSVKGIRFVGANKNIIQFIFSDENGIDLKGISFTHFDKFKEYIEQRFDLKVCEKIFNGDIKDVCIKFDIVYTIEINEYKDSKNVQLVVKDFRESIVKELKKK